MARKENVTMPQSTETNGQIDRHATNKRLFVAGVLGLLGAGAFWIIYSNVLLHTGLALLDMPVFSWMIAHRSPTLTTLMMIITDTLSPVALGIITVIIAVIWIRRTRELWRPLLLVGSLALAFTLSSLIKNTVERLRPPSIEEISPFASSFSFPSGHTIGTAVFLFVLGYLICSRRPRQSKYLLIAIAVAVIGTILVSITRLYLGFHWLTDVSASVALATAILAVVIAIDPLEPRWSKIWSKADANTRQ